MPWAFAFSRCRWPSCALYVVQEIFLQAQVLTYLKSVLFFLRLVFQLFFCLVKCVYLFWFFQNYISLQKVNIQSNNFIHEMITYKRTITRHKMNSTRTVSPSTEIISIRIVLVEHFCIAQVVSNQQLIGFIDSWQCAILYTGVGWQTQSKSQKIIQPFAVYESSISCK